MARARIALVDAKTILTRTSGYLAGFTHSLQPYVGCQLSCVYCYVRELAVQRANPFGLPWSRWLVATSGCPRWHWALAIAVLTFIGESPCCSHRINRCSVAVSSAGR